MSKFSIAISTVSIYHITSFQHKFCKRVWSNEISKVLFNAYIFKKYIWQIFSRGYILINIIITIQE